MAYGWATDSGAAWRALHVTYEADCPVGIQRPHRLPLACVPDTFAILDMSHPGIQTSSDLSARSSNAITAPKTTMTSLDTRVDVQTKEALKTDLTLRCLIKTKYERDESRASAVFIAWAQSLAETLSINILQNVEQQTSGFSVELTMIQMLPSRKLYISFDIFLDECDKDLRSNIHDNFGLKRPVYQVTQKGTSCFVFRNPKADTEVTKEYIRFSKIDKGPRPFFSDLRHPPIYEDGVRREDLQHLLLPYDWRNPTKRHREATGSPGNEDVGELDGLSEKVDSSRDGTHSEGPDIEDDTVETRT